jgi:tRNA-modifying protein YgfZ
MWAMAIEALPEIDAQYRALREEVAALDRSARAILLVEGPDAAAYLNGQLTNEVEGLAEGTGCYAALLDRKGHIQSDMRVLRLAADEIWLDLDPGGAAGVLKHLRTYSVGHDAELEDRSEDWAIVSLIGPRSLAAAGFEPLDPEHAHRLRAWDGIEVRGVRTDLGLDLIVAAADAERLRSLLGAAGVVDVSEAAVEILRVESGRPRFGAEITSELMPAEAGIVERAIDFEKGCYIGQEPVARLHYRGKPNRRLRGVRLSAPAKAGETLSVGDREVGSIASACVSPALGPIALAVIRREAEAGDSVSVGAAGNSGEVVELPFGPTS